MKKLENTEKEKFKDLVRKTYDKRCQRFKNNPQKYYQKYQKLTAICSIMFSPLLRLDQNNYEKDIIVEFTAFCQESQKSRRFYSNLSKLKDYYEKDPVIDVLLQFKPKEQLDTYELFISQFTGRSIESILEQHRYLKYHNLTPACLCRSTLSNLTLIISSDQSHFFGKVYETEDLSSSLINPNSISQSINEPFAEVNFKSSTLVRAYLDEFIYLANLIAGKKLFNERLSFLHVLAACNDYSVADLEKIFIDLDFTPICFKNIFIRHDEIFAPLHSQFIRPENLAHFNLKKTIDQFDLKENKQILILIFRFSTSIEKTTKTALKVFAIKTFRSNYYVASSHFPGKGYSKLQFENDSNKKNKTFLQQLNFDGNLDQIQSLNLYLFKPTKIESSLKKNYETYNFLKDVYSRTKFLDLRTNIEKLKKESIDNQLYVPFSNLEQHQKIMKHTFGFNPQTGKSTADKSEMGFDMRSINDDVDDDYHLKNLIKQVTDETLNSLLPSYKATGKLSASKEDLASLEQQLYLKVFDKIKEQSKQKSDISRDSVGAIEDDVISEKVQKEDAPVLKDESLEEEKKSSEKQKKRISRSRSRSVSSSSSSESSYSSSSSSSSSESSSSSDDRRKHKKSKKSKKNKKRKSRKNKGRDKKRAKQSKKHKKRSVQARGEEKNKGSKNANKSKE